MFLDQGRFVVICPCFVQRMPSEGEDYAMKRNTMSSD